MTGAKLFLTPPPVRVAKVPMPEWGEGAALHVRRLSAFDLDRHWQETKEKTGLQTGAWLVALAACDDKGNRIFADADVEQIMQWPPVVLKRVANAADEINDLKEDPVEAAEKK